MDNQAMAAVLDDFSKDTRWLDTHYDELKKSHPEQYVAVYHETVVDHDPDLDSLITRLAEKYHDEKGKVAIEYISDKDIEMALCA